jgi:glutamine synthetase
MADQLMTFKYVLKNVAWQAGKSLTFMPKPIFQDNGSGMHCHMSLWNSGEPLFYSDTGYGGLSDIARWYIGGILHHAASVIAFTNPTTNSFKRLVPGYEAPVNLVYSQRNRSASVRIPLAGQSPKSKRIEFRCPDSTSNPYLGFAAMLMAGLDGIQNRIHPGDALDKNLYDLPPEEAAQVPTVCGSLDMALAALDSDRAFLTAGGVFDDDMIDAYITLKQEEIDRLRMTTHPVEFDMYYSC